MAGNLVWKNKALEYLRACIVDICFLLLFFSLLAFKYVV